MALNFDIAIIGGGASGLAAAIAAAEELEKNKKRGKIAVLEANVRVGKKLLATGNGRCNLTNTGVALSHYHGDREFLSPVLELYSPQYIMDYFASLGLLCKEQDEGRVYPYNLQASAVLDVLRRQLERFGVTELCDFQVTAVKKIAAGFEVSSKEQKITSRKVILASGGLAYPQLGANESGYQLAKALGHTCTRLFPALVQLKTDPLRAKPLKGARSPAAATLLVEGNPVQTANGEVQFTEYGLSGICIFELSRKYGELHGKKKAELLLDLMPEYTERQIFSVLKHRCDLFRDLPASELLNGCLNKLVGPEVIKTALPNSAKYAGELKPSDLALVANTVKQFRFPVTGTMPWKDAQVTAGGIPLAEVENSMQSKVCRGLYLAGELLNVDGDCGGFNLHWAWSSGITAGRSAARSFL